MEHRLHRFKYLRNRRGFQWEFRLKTTECVCVCWSTSPLETGHGEYDRRQPPWPGKDFAWEFTQPSWRAPGRAPHILMYILVSSHLSSRWIFLRPPASEQLWANIRSACSRRRGGAVQWKGRVGCPVWLSRVQAEMTHGTLPPHSAPCVSLCVCVLNQIEP